VDARYEAPYGLGSAADSHRVRNPGMRQPRVYHPMSLGLGIAVVRARRIADETIAAADVVASLADPTAQARSTAAVTDLRTVSAAAAVAVAQPPTNKG
jgi:malic enzyme